MLILPQVNHVQGLFFLFSDVFHLYVVCAWVHHTMLACHWLCKIMEVNEALQSPSSSSYSGAVIPQGITGRAIETHYCRNHIATEGCKLQGKWMEHTGEERVGVRVRFSFTTICVDTSLFDSLAVWNMEDDLIKLCLGWILMQSSAHWLNVNPPLVPL